MKIGTWLLGLVAVFVLLAVFLVINREGRSSDIINSSAVESSGNPSASGSAVLVCHQDKDKKLQTNFSVEANATYPMIQSAAFALKGANEDVRSKLNELKMKHPILSTILALPGLAGLQLINATCSTVDKNGEAICEDKVTSEIFGFDQKTLIEPNGTYVRTIILEDGKKILVEGKEGDPSDISVTTEEGHIVWHRSDDGTETITADSITADTVITEKADCSGTLTSTWDEGTVINAEWTYQGDNRTSGSLISISPEESKNFSLDW